MRGLVVRAMAQLSVQAARDDGSRGLCGALVGMLFLLTVRDGRRTLGEPIWDPLTPVLTVSGRR
jgi:hypothetical protein